MTIACVRVPHYSIRISTLDRAELSDTPIILRGESRGQPSVLDATASATRLGVRKGQQIREATSLVPLALVVPPDPVRELQVASEILSAMLKLSPLVEPDEQESGCWYIDLVGLERHYGTQEDAARQLLACVPSHLLARVAVAPTKFGARVAAGVTKPGNVLVIASEQLNPFLSGASVSWLPIDSRIILEMQDVGIDDLGRLARMEVGKVSARFGPAGIMAWELANGIDRRQVVAPSTTPSVTETLEMPTPAVSREMLLVGLRHMVTRAFRRRELRGNFVREVSIRASMEQGRSWIRTLSLKVPADAHRVIEAIGLRLRDIEIPGPIEMVTMTLTGIITEAARQQAIDQLKPRDLSSLQEVVDQLRQRYGATPLYRIVEVERWSRHPERQFALLPVTFEF